MVVGGNDVSLVYILSKRRILKSIVIHKSLRSIVEIEVIRLISLAKISVKIGLGVKSVRILVVRDNKLITLLIVSYVCIVHILLGKGLTVAIGTLCIVRRICLLVGERFIERLHLLPIVSMINY
jgi:hypothetical protein